MSHIPDWQTADSAVQLYTGDCLDVLADLPAVSVDTVITDPPYGLEFMGKEWDKLQTKQWHGEREEWQDHHSKEHIANRLCKLPRYTTGSAYMKQRRSGEKDDLSKGAYLRHSVEYAYEPNTVQAWHYEWAKAVLRVAKPGAFLLAFGGTRTFHRLACAIEDTGWEIRDTLCWLYGQGFPKSLDVSKAIDKATGREQEIIGKKGGKDGSGFGNVGHGLRSTLIDITAPATAEAKLWSGWGTALKPGWESILVAQKPLTPDRERHTIVENLTQLEAQLWSLLPVNVAVESFGLSPQEYSAACGFARWSADKRSSTQAALYGLTDTSRFASVLTSCLSIVRSWRTILAESSENTSTSTTVTESNTTTDWKTLRSCLSALTPSTIIEAALRQPGSWWLALPAARSFNAALVSIANIHAPFVPDGATSLGEQEGLRPDWCPIILAMKPIDGTFAQNALAHGVAGLNIDGARIPAAPWHCERGDNPVAWSGATFAQDEWTKKHMGVGKNRNGSPLGRWPANVVLSHTPECVCVGRKRVKGAPHLGQKNLELTKQYGGGTMGGGRVTPNSGYADADGLETVEAWECSADCPVRMLDEQSGTTSVTGQRSQRSRAATVQGTSIGTNNHESTEYPGDSGGASRFFYCAKASRSERGEGNNHPTVKPLKLIEWLCRLTATPTGGVVLDPFLGSGTTALACLRTGRKCIGIEKDRHYFDIVVKRIKATLGQLPLLEKV